MKKTKTSILAFMMATSLVGSELPEEIESGRTSVSSDPSSQIDQYEGDNERGLEISSSERPEIVFPPVLTHTNVEVIDEQLEVRKRLLLIEAYSKLILSYQTIIDQLKKEIEEIMLGRDVLK